MGFAKLDQGIVNSTIWVQPPDVLKTWIWFLSQADRHGVVRVAAPALAMTCMVPLDRMREILALLEAPDPDSRTSAHEGRRIEKIEGGWLILNYLAYRQQRDTDERREYQQAWDRANRPSGHARRKAAQDSPTAVRPQSDKSDAIRPRTTHAEAEAEAEAELPIGESVASTEDFTGRATLAGLACRQMRDAGCAQTNPSHPDLLAALAEGVTPEVLADTVREGIAQNIRKPFGWAIATARGRHADGARTVPMRVVDAARGPPQTLVPTSKTGQTIAMLEGMKRELRNTRTDPGALAEAAPPELDGMPSRSG